MFNVADGVIEISKAVRSFPRPELHKWTFIAAECVEKKNVTKVHFRFQN